MPTNATLSHVLDAFPALRVTVLGDAMLDSYLEGAASRICREAPVPNILISGRTDMPGGAGNTAVNVGSLGARVSFLGVTGDDNEAALLRHALCDSGVDAEHVLTEPGRRTVVKHRIVAAGQLLLRFEQGDSAGIHPETEKALIDRLDELYPASDAVIVSDYGSGTITPRVVEALARWQARRPCTLVVDSRHRLPLFREIGVTAIKPNYEETQELLGPGVLEGYPSRIEAITRQADEILTRTGARIAAVTLDSDGALVLERGRPAYRTWAAPARRSCVAGAGDTFIATMTLALAAGASTPTMAELAQAAADVVVGKDGTAPCSARELREHVAGTGKYVRDPRQLASRIDFLRQQGRRIVFTNGCFDLLHAGHIAFLKRARALGDVLVVGVNSDASIRRLKGPDRPINTLEDRLQVLTALGCIDHLIDFDDDTACGLVRILRPDVFVKGGDHAHDRLPEAPLVEALGGVVRILPLQRECTTRELIERIRRTPALTR